MVPSPPDGNGGLVAGQYGRARQLGGVAGGLGQAHIRTGKVELNGFANRFNFIRITF